MKIQQISDSENEEYFQNIDFFYAISFCYTLMYLFKNIWF
jgi:hypothetical protein